MLATNYLPQLHAHPPGEFSRRRAQIHLFVPFILAIVLIFPGCSSKADPANTAKLVGKWVCQVGDSSGVVLQFTPGGRVLLVGSQTERERMMAGPRSGAKTGNFQCRKSELVLIHQKRGDSYKWTYDVEFLSDTEFMLIETSSPGTYRNESFDNLSGTWSKTEGEAQKNEPESSSLTALEEKRTAIRKLLAKRETDREILIARLEGYGNDVPSYESWQVRARELKTLVAQIDLLSSRLETFDLVIARMQTRSRHQQRVAELKDLGISDKELSQVTQKSMELDEELKSAQLPLVEEIDLETFVKKQLSRDR